MALAPSIHFDPRYSDPAAPATSWESARTLLERAELYWISTVRRNGQPHVTPLIGLWLDERFWFCTGPAEQKARNLAGNPRATITTGASALGSGVDIVVEGVATPQHDEQVLGRIAAAYVDKFGPSWSFTVRDGGFHHDAGGHATVYAVQPITVHAFAKGTYSQTSFRFPAMAG
ncbi:pyridoxamine 5'-phosphate oxidase family protein [Hoyosella sp. G463]|uniref:Pyridoxamine 5'-phosphate oxidase family protein n=1 Tax=Lolliginicoccus lacisalsi TaxID=2742202 RepID=A0A927JDY8_9ACTN|nr:pyridoxamine 5'-phosphate oxidase family protein [Lolliginicoccus lacisalsi]MBD8507579.1 pyridoxamine 5'-phosphate oxidase family protein [Lolliginicoccus lacisalsi]